MNKLTIKQLNILSGKVVRGNGYGKRIGFPTANIDRRQWGRLKVRPRLGIYAGTIIICYCKEGVHRADEVISTSRFRLPRRHSGAFVAPRNDKLYKAGIVIGPLDKQGLPKIEAYLLNFRGDLYGKKIAIQLLTFLHPFRKYKSEIDLKQGIAEDIRKVRQIKKLIM